MFSHGKGRAFWGGREEEEGYKRREVISAMQIRRDPLFPNALKISYAVLLFKERTGQVDPGR